MWRSLYTDCFNKSVWFDDDIVWSFSWNVKSNPMGSMCRDTFLMAYRNVRFRLEKKTEIIIGNIS